MYNETEAALQQALFAILCNAKKWGSISKRFARQPMIICWMQEMTAGTYQVQNWQ